VRVRIPKISEENADIYFLDGATACCRASVTSATTRMTASLPVHGLMIFERGDRWSLGVMMLSHQQLPRVFKCLGSE